MKYLCLIYSDGTATAAMSSTESGILLDERVEYGERLRSKGHLLAAEALHPVEAATTLRFRNGRLWATNGPFAKTPEKLAGFFLVEVRDLNDAIQLAARNPAARYGTVEIRPIRECGSGLRSSRADVTERSQA